MMVITQVLDVRPHRPLAEPPGGGLRHQSDVNDRPSPFHEEGRFPLNVSDHQPKGVNQRAQSLPHLGRSNDPPGRRMSVENTGNDGVKAHPVAHRRANHDIPQETFDPTAEWEGGAYPL